MSNLLSELKRRHMYRVAAAYVVVAWVLVQVVNNVAPVFDLPPWVARAVVLVLALGFPIALVFAWVLELNGPSAPAKTGGADWVLAAVATAFIGMFAYEQLASSRATVTAQTGVEAAREAATKPAGVSVAVLPFVNLSSDKEQDFFSDGMTEDIITALAKIPDLRVVARESAFRYKGEKNDMRAVGQALNATHLIAGSVRKVGTRVRITAQLVKADDGLNIWADNYDRDLTDVFAIQEEIARAIATSLRMPLGLKPGENLVNNRTKNEASYEDYLKAKALIRARNFQAAVGAVKLLEEAVARDPDFAPAWGFLGVAYRYVPRFDPVRLSGAAGQARATVESARVKAEAAAQRAMKLDPTNADAYYALADVERDGRKYVASVAYFLRSLALDPDNPDVLNTYSVTLAELGYLKQSIPVRERLLAVEPYVPVFKNNFAVILWASGQTDAAIALLERPPAGSPFAFARIAAGQGRYSEAADAIELVRINDPVLSGQLSAGVRLLRMAPAVSAAPQTLPDLGALGFVYLYAGAPERALEYHEGNLESGLLAGMEIVPLWSPTYASLRPTQRFKKFVQNAGMVDYWRAKGWPDLCHPTTGDDFECN